MYGSAASTVDPSRVGLGRHLGRPPGGWSSGPYDAPDGRGAPGDRPREPGHVRRRRPLRLVRSPAHRAPGLLASGAAAEHGLLGGDPLRRPHRDPHGLADLLVGARRRLPGGARRRAARDPEVDARDRPSPAHRAPRDLLEAVLGAWGRQVRGLDPRRRPRRLGPGAPEGRVRLRARDQPRPADPVPLLDLHRAAGGRARS